MSQGKSETMPMQFFFLGGGGVEAVCYDIVQVENVGFAFKIQVNKNPDFKSDL